jgi:enolase-phosphatase E1
MPTFHRIHHLLLDIEGTTSDIRFVYDVLMPFARARMEKLLRDRWDDPEVADARISCYEQLGVDDLGLYQLLNQLLDWSDRDVKATGLKKLQGILWREGYARGQLKSHVYPDVVPALRRWNDAGKTVRIYSSGSVTAQKAFFAHTDFGDLLPLLVGHFDTTTGPKREAGSYRAIAKQIAALPETVLFISDIVAELDAARQAGMQTCLCVRPTDPPTAEGSPEITSVHPLIRSFEELVL